MIGQTISHYKILEKLGEGGMGVVYKALDTKLNRTVALKFLPHRLTQSDTDRTRFTQEAQLAATLNHPNICTIFDIAENDGELFIAMEFVDGQTLREKKGTIGFKQAIDIGVQLADGLAAAHEKGIVHRDIKPENIMIRKDGIAQIMDFGLAKLRGNVTRLTKEGSTVGTAGYMSPEQVQGQDADHRSDIFSLGVVIYELFAGQPPFKGVHETALAYEIVNVDAPPMSSVKPEIDPSLDAIILECLEKDPNERTQSAKQVAIDLKRYKRESGRARASRITAAMPISKFERAPQNAAPQQPRSRWRLMWPAITGILAIALIAVSVVLREAETAPHTPVRFAITLPRDQVIDLVTYTAAAISPDGSRIVYQASGRLYQRKIESFDAEAIPGTEDGTSPFFSPDGKWVGFFSEGAVKKVPLSGGPPVVVTRVSDNRGGAWAPDGSLVLSTSGRSGLIGVRSDGSERREITKVDSVQGERTHRWPQVLPDGKTVLFTVGMMDSPDYYEDAEIASVNMETGERKTIMKGASTARYVSTGHLVFSRTGILFAIPFDLGTLTTHGTASPLVQNVSGDPTTGAANYSISGRGTLAYIPGHSDLANRTLALQSAAGSVSTFPAPSRPYMEPALSPDGRQVAVIVGSGKDEDIWVYDTLRNTMTRLTFGGQNRTPKWSPDGKRIAYCNNEVGNPRIVIRQADGSGSAEEIRFDYIRAYLTCWSRDGSTLVLAGTGKGRGWDIFTVALTGDRTSHDFLTGKYDEWLGSLSPDGKWIAYNSNESGTSQVYVMPFPGGFGKWQISADWGKEPRWSSDGKTLYYTTKHGLAAVGISGTLSLVIGRSREIYKDISTYSAESGINFDIAPDGRFLFTRPKDETQPIQQINVVMNWFDELTSSAGSGK